MKNSNCIYTNSNIRGCTNSEAINYDPFAVIDSNNCFYPNSEDVYIWVSPIGDDQLNSGFYENSPLKTINKAITSTQATNEKSEVIISSPGFKSKLIRAI